MNTIDVKISNKVFRFLRKIPFDSLQIKRKQFPLYISTMSETKMPLEHQELRSLSSPSNPMVLASEHTSSNHSLKPELKTNEVIKTVEESDVQPPRGVSARAWFAEMQKMMKSESKTDEAMRLLYFNKKNMQDNRSEQSMEEVINNIIQIGIKPPENIKNLSRIAVTVKSKNINEHIVVDVHPAIEDIVKDFIETIKKMQYSENNVKPSRSHIGFLKRIFSSKS